MRTLVLLLALLGGCTGLTVNPLGRPCDNQTPCGPGSRCDPTSRTCVEARTPDAARKDLADLRAGDLRAGDLPDGLASDQRADALASDQRLDAVLSPDGGCGVCNGCCDGNTCRPLGSAQSASKCGAGGAACKSCDDGEQCTTDACSATGSCLNTAKPNNTTCDDKLACTHGDKCTTAGVCAGTSFSCDDKLACTADSCLGAPPPAGCANQLQPGSCLIAGVCHASGAKNASDPCQECIAALESSSWSLAAGCISTLAGTGVSGLLNGPALSARFANPRGIAATSTGKVYVADYDNHVIRLIDGGVVTTIAGTGGAAGLVNGPAATARFRYPNDVAVDAAGKVYVADNDNNVIRLIDGGVVSTFAGTGVGGKLDGPVASAQLRGPNGLAFDGAGKLYVSDSENHAIRVISGGQVTTLAGTGAAGFADGPTSTAQFNAPFDVAVDSAGAVYVCDRSNNRIRKIAGGQVSTIGGGASAGFLDGPAASSLFNLPIGIAVSGSGTVYVGDESNNRIRVIAGGTVSTLTGSTPGFKDGPLPTALLNSPGRISLVGGLLYLGVPGNQRVRVIRF